MISTNRKEYMKNYVKIWRRNNKDKIKNYLKKVIDKNPLKYKENKIKASEKFKKKNPNKIKMYTAKYGKKRFRCLFCQKSHLIRNKKTHFSSNIHKKNVKRFSEHLNKHLN